MEKVEAILDTNVLLSGLVSRNGKSFKILQLLAEEKFNISISVPVILEYEAILKKKLNRKVYSDQDIHAIIDYICKIGRHIKVYYLWRPILKDPYDDHLLEVAVATNAKWIITYNVKDFERASTFGISAVTPNEFLRVLEEVK
ncbi:putative toxin-antitoxin system toxin component, PIN family [Spirochaeta lutea]|uniref:DNA-binding protein n=1 Tax=Spirochaeta lutea TaxID=1480694 RepID=A0A098QYH6_9SPIO|nr:putative toxin-antitoxin system toxin component, PIN family [Spirochaeta lutea]KGE71542.1 DNA-binding protein [Spirochaeta lutea]